MKTACRNFYGCCIFHLSWTMQVPDLAILKQTCIGLTLHIEAGWIDLRPKGADTQQKSRELQREGAGSNTLTQQNNRNSIKGQCLCVIRRGNSIFSAGAFRRADGRVGSRHLYKSNGRWIVFRIPTEVGGQVDAD